MTNKELVMAMLQVGSQMSPIDVIDLGEDHPAIIKWSAEIDSKVEQMFRHQMSDLIDHVMDSLGKDESYELMDLVRAYQMKKYNKSDNDGTEKSR